MFQNKMLKMGNSIIKGYPNYAGIFSLADAYNIKYKEWLLSHFIQLQVFNNERMGLRIDYAVPNIWSTFPWIAVETISRKTIERNWHSYIEFSKEMINDNKYVMSLIDTTSLSQWETVNNTQPLRECLLTGYIHPHNAFTFYGNVGIGKYQKSYITFEDYEQTNRAILEQKHCDWLSGIMLLSKRTLFDFGLYDYREEYMYYFNKPLFGTLLQDFLNEYPSAVRWTTTSIFYDRKNISDYISWGIGVYDVISKHIFFEHKNKGQIDLRGLYILAEHKKIIIEATKLIPLSNTLKNQIFYELQCILNYSKQLLNLAIKYNIKRDSYIIERMNQTISTIKEMEKLCYPKIIESVKLFL